MAGAIPYYQSQETVELDGWPATVIKREFCSMSFFNKADIILV